MDPQHRNIILNNIEALVANTKDYDSLVEHLLDKQVVTRAQLEYINFKVPKEKRCQELYTLITKRGPRAFEQLYNLAYLSGNSNISMIISPNRSTNVDIYMHGEGIPLDFSEEYKLNSNPKGMVLIVNIENTKIKDQQRLGSALDVTHLDELWTNLGHKVIYYIDLTKEAFKQEFKQFVKNFKGDCFTLFLMGHGKQVQDNITVAMTDSRDVNIEWIIKKLSSVKAPHIADKPKLIFIVSCRGDLPDYGIDITKAQDWKYKSLISTDGTQPKIRPSVSNLMLIYPCSPGFVSYRHNNFGSFFIQELVHVFKIFADKECLEDMIKRVDRNLMNHSITFKKGFQTVNVNTIGFNKKLFLKERRNPNNNL
ncbi:caspase Dronc [Cimex lectularius]|uniref:Caspase n=1 Tax=Cimex lectularius TaxID=79782 RepID=A0A8I6SFP4_CIMLE|nr:caspase Dronc [Cimex lectularius]